MLSENQPDFNNLHEKDTLFLRYTYEFMPKGIITRFIVVMHIMIADPKLVWKTGVILEKNNTRVINPVPQFRFLFYTPLANIKSSLKS